MVNDRDCRADLRAYLRRLYQRQLSLGLDLLHQRTDWRPRGNADAPVAARRETRTEQRRIDAIGLALLVVGIGSLQVMLDQGKELDWFNSREIIILTIVAVVSLSFLIVWELTDDNPIVDLSLFKSRNFTIGCLCISLAYMLYFGAIVLLPQLLQEVYGYTATSGRFSLGAGWIDSGSAVADYWPLRPQARHAPAGDVQLYHVRRVLLLARVYVRTGNGLWRVRVAAVYSGLCRGVLLYATDHHHAFRFTA